MKYNFEKENKIDKRKKIIKEMLILIIEIALVIGVAFLIVRFAILKTTIVGDSMDKTLKNQEKIIINKFAYKIFKPDRFDVIVFKQSGKEHNYYNIKRVIGLPGEEIQIKKGRVYINNKELEEKIKVDVMNSAGLAEQTIKLDSKEYFVLGDNRNKSEDSRYASIGTVVSGDIIGKAWFTLSPFRFISGLNSKK